jgi:hypothetical protein
MPRRQLQQALGALHRELESGAKIGPEDRAALQQAIREIEEALKPTDIDPRPEREGPLSRRVSGLIESLETSHPRFAEILQSLSESLANLGI